GFGERACQPGFVMQLAGEEDAAASLQTVGDLLQELHRRQVDTRDLAQVEHDPISRIEIGNEIIDQTIRRAEEQVAAQLVDDDALAVLMKLLAFGIRTRPNRADLACCRAAVNDWCLDLFSNEQAYGYRNTDRDGDHEVVAHGDDGHE